jgi:predicted transcriptional regulator
MAKRMAAAKAITVSDQLRAVIQERKLSTYMVGKLASIDPTRVALFLRGKQLRSNSIDRICTALRLELRPIEND